MLLFITFLKVIKSLNIYVPRKHDWEYVYNNFHTLGSPQKNNKRKNLQDVTNTTSTTVNNHTVEFQDDNERKKLLLIK